MVKEEQVADPRVLDNSQILSLIMKSFNDRKLIKDSLSKSIINVLEQADNQLNLIARFIKKIKLKFYKYIKC